MHSTARALVAVTLALGGAIGCGSDDADEAATTTTDAPTTTAAPQPHHPHRNVLRLQPRPSRHRPLAALTSRRRGRGCLSPTVPHRRRSVSARCVARDHRL